MKKPLYVLFDGDCSLCKRTLKKLLALDVLRRLTPVNLRDRQELERLGLGHLKEEDLKKDLTVVKGPRTWRGFEAYRTLAGRLPLLWPLWPFLWIWPVTALGRAVYRRIADTRSTGHCQL